MSLSEKLDAAKQKASLRDFEVTITETLQRTVTVQAENRDDAEQIVSDQWHRSEHILDAEDFTGVEFLAALDNRSRMMGRQGKENFLR